MKNFIYKLKDKNGKTLYGFMEAQDKRGIKSKLRGSGYYFVGAYPCQESKVFNTRASLQTLYMFTHRLSSLIGSGIPILAAMNILWRQTEERSMQLVISHIRRKLEAGSKISEALDDFPRIFPPMYRALIGVAEKAGGLVVVLKNLTSYLQYQRQMISRVKKATLYPTIVITFAIIVLLVMFWFVVPIFEEVLTKLKVEIPLLTRIILNISHTFKSLYFIFGVLAIIGLLLYAYKRLRTQSRFAALADRIKLNIPFFGHIIQIVALSRFMHSMRMLFGAGLSLIESFEVAKATVSHHTMIQEIDKVQRQVEKGNALYESFKQSKMFPVMMIEMIGVGESSGTMVKVFESLAMHFDEDVDYSLNKFLTLMEPFLIIFVGVIVIITLLAIYMPIFSLWQTLAG